jgi:hypothetical protein
MLVLLNSYRKYLLDNLFSIVCFGFVCFYLVIKFETNRERVLYLLCFALLFGTPFLYMGFCRKIFIENVPFIEAVRYYKIKIILLIAIIVSILFLGNWQLLLALLLGCLLFGIFIVGYFSLKYRGK